MGIDLKKYLKGRFYKLDEVSEQPAREQIAAVIDGQFGKPVLVFESGRQVALNNKSLGNLMRDLGDKTDDWIGRWVEIGAGETKNHLGVLVDVIEVTVVDASAPAAKVSPPAVRRAPDMDDEIPF
jgi:hypothetical protein